MCKSPPEVQSAYTHAETGSVWRPSCDALYGPVCLPTQSTASALGSRGTQLSIRIRKTLQRRVDDLKSEAKAERQEDNEAFQLAGTRGAWCLCSCSCLRLSSAPGQVRKLRLNLYLPTSVAQGPVTLPGVALEDVNSVFHTLLLIALVEDADL